MGRKLGFSMRGKKYSLTLLGLAGLIAAGILTGLLCGEFLCRAFVRFPPEKKYLIFSSLGCAEIPPASRDADLFWRSSPEFRGGVYVKTKPAGGVRVICLGDSVTQGYPLGTNADLPAEQTYPRFLEETLKTVFPQAMVEVINAGIGGYSSLQGYRYLRDTLTGYAPDLVISWFGVDDGAPAIFFTDKEQRGTGSDRCKKEHILEYSKLYLFLKTMWFEPQKRVSPRDFYFNCRRMHRLCQRQGSRLVFVVPFSVDRRANTIDYLSGYKQELERLRERYHCEVIDIVPRLRQLDPKSLFIDGAHANGKGNEIIAELLGAVVGEEPAASGISGSDAGTEKEL
jgi:Lysophospholipase L1 and related esterases